MNILARARKLETVIARTFSDAVNRIAPSGAREPLEIVHAILDLVEEEVHPAGRGACVFPFNRLKISVVASTREERARFEAVFDETPTLHDRILQRVRAAGCEVPDLSAKIVFVSEAAAGWMNPQFHVEFARTPQMAAVVAPAPLPRRLELAVVRGTAEPSTYLFTQARVDIGRCAQVRDRAHRLIRTNHVAFADEDTGVNESVSRCHAHVEYDSHSGDYRIYDDRSAHGTGVLRNGRTLAVSGARGIRLLSGDQIVLGEACPRVTIDGGAAR